MYKQNWQSHNNVCKLRENNIYEPVKFLSVNKSVKTNDANA